MVATTELIHLAALRAKLGRDYGTNHPIYAELEELAREMQAELDRIEMQWKFEVGELRRQNARLRAVFDTLQGGVLGCFQQAHVEMAAGCMAEQVKRNGVHP